MMKNVHPNISVGIMTRETIDFSFIGKFTCNLISEMKQGIFSAKTENGEIVVSGAGGSISAKEIIFEPSDISTCVFELKNVTIGVNFHWEQNEDQKFQGALKLIIENDKITAVNVLPVENYLVSVISSEMSAKSSIDLLKAHAIISRSWLIAQIEKQENLTVSSTNYISISETDNEYIRWYDREDHRNFHVCADYHYQRYQGTTRSHNPYVVKAIAETAGIILSYEGVVCDARFSKCCGGIAELFENCWEPVNHPYLTAVIDNPVVPAGFETDLKIDANAVKWIHGNPDAFCNTDDKEVLTQVLNEYDWTAKDFYRWKVEYSQEQLADLILRRSGRDFGQIIDLIPVERGGSGRLIKLKIIGSKKTLTVGKELEIRRWLSESHLYSSAFTVEKQDIENGIPQKIILHGAGWGHGVGLCQIGAAVMGHKGYKYDEILLHYFKNVDLVKRY